MSGFLIACGGDDVTTPLDAAMDARIDAEVRPDATSSGCNANSDCDDGLFCTGAEACDPSAARANALGCVAGDNPCATGGTCDEGSSVCMVDCTAPDADGDGSDAMACGGLDCDDSDGNRYPGNVEVCDSAHHDEDCDPTTFGYRDADGDGSPDASCCNEDTGGGLSCGDDCDDARPGTNPDNPEVCNLRDDDCDGLIDEEVQVVLTPDADGDMFGTTASDAMTMLGCGPIAGWVIDRTDCDDAVATIHPGATELCNAVDDDCNMVTDDVVGGCDCTLGASRSCGSSVGECTTGSQSCVAGGIWGDCSGVAASVEVCNMMDDDCDGSTDEGLRISCYPDADNDGYAPMGASATSTCPSTDAARAVAPFNRCPPLSTGTAPTATQYDCNDAMSPAVFPTACYTDGDGDSYGRDGSAVAMRVCGACPAGFANRTGDCCDADSASKPGASCGGRNLCGSYDRNCSGSATTCIGAPTGICIPGGGGGTLCLCSGGSCAGFPAAIPGCGSSASYQVGCANISGACSPHIMGTRTQTCR